MKTPSILLCLIFICSTAVSQVTTGIAIIPEPVSIQKTNGVFSVPQNIIIEAPLNKELETTISFLKDRFTIPTGSKVNIVQSHAEPTIRLVLNKAVNKTL